MEEKGLTKQELKKHVAFIHSSSCSISLVQRKISNALLFHAYDALLSKDVHRIELSKLCKMIDFTSHNQQVIKDALKDLTQTIIEWNVIDENLDGQSWEASTLLASVGLKNGICEYSYSYHLKNLLYSPIKYGKVSLAVQAKFKSTYGLALYENCNRFRTIGQTPVFEMGIFRGLMGISNDKYPIFRDFKRRVLVPAINEVNTYSDIFIEPIYEKNGQKPISVKFLIQPRRKMPVIGQIETGDEKKLNNITPEMQVINSLKSDFGFNDSTSRELISQFGLPSVNEKIGYVKKIQSEKGADTIKNPFLYLKKILELANNNSQAVVQSVNKPKHSMQLEEEYKKFVKERALSLFLKLPSDTQLKLIHDFENFMQNGGGVRYRIILRNFTHEKIYNDAFTQDEFLQFCCKGRVDYGTDISIDNYAEIHYSKEAVE